MTEQCNLITTAVDAGIAYEIYLLLIANDGKQINAFGPTPFAEITIVSTGCITPTSNSINQLCQLKLESVVHGKQQEQREAIRFESGIAYQWINIVSGPEIGERIRFLVDYLEDLHS